MIIKTVVWYKHVGPLHHTTVFIYVSKFFFFIFEILEL